MGDMTEYQGCRYTCKDCIYIKDDQNCKIQGLEILPTNNICKEFKARIINSSTPPFNFDQYLEFLGSDFYRPYGITDEILGYIDRPSFYTHDQRSKIPIYQTYDKPYCKVHFPRCFVKKGNHHFEINYKRYREVKTIEDGKIYFDLHYWKDNPNQRRFQKEIYGTYQEEIK